MVLRGDGFNEGVRRFVSMEMVRAARVAASHVGMMFCALSSATFRCSLRRCARIQERVGGESEVSKHVSWVSRSSGGMSAVCFLTVSLAMQLFGFAATSSNYAGRAHTKEGDSADTLENKMWG